MRRLVVGSLLAALCCTGCGGGTSLSTQQLRTRATRLCSTAQRQTGRIAVPSSPAGGAAFLASGVAALDPELKGLRALRAPGDLSQVYSTSVNAFAGKLAALHAAARTLAAGGDPVTAMKGLEQQLAPLEAEEDGAWRALEIPACLNR